MTIRSRTTRHVTRTRPLTQDERLQFGRQLARHHQDIVDVTTSREYMAKIWSQRQMAAAHEVDRLALLISHDTIKEDLACALEFDLDKKTYALVAPDGSVVREGAMTEEDLRELQTQGLVPNE